MLILVFWGLSSFVGNVKGGLVTKLFLGTLTFLFAKTFELITLVGTSTFFVLDKDFFLKEKALKKQTITNHLFVKHLRNKW